MVALGYYGERFCPKDTKLVIMTSGEVQVSNSFILSLSKL